MAPWYYYIANGFGVGELPLAPGTWGSILGLVLFYCMWELLSPLVVGTTVLIVIVISFPVCNWTSMFMARWDPSNVVLDEIVGQWIACWPTFWLQSWPYTVGSGYIACFFLFRFYDVTKIPPANWLENLKGRGGIVLDDLMAGVYANLTLILVGKLFLG